MTYRRDSEIYYPHGYVTEAYVGYRVPTFQEISNRPHKVAWFTEQCDDNQTKLNQFYAQKINKYIPVHIYGPCGTYSCEPPNKNTLSNHCYKMLEKNYKFYLSFENSICAEFVSNNLYNILQYNVIPVVFGNIDYNKITPPMSVINAYYLDHLDVLGRYLNVFDLNYVMYVKYLQWKENYVVSKYPTYHVLCQLCEQLNEPLVYYNYKDVENWFHCNKK